MALVQSIQGSTTYTLPTGTLTVTLGTPTVAGHSLVVMAAASGTTTNPSAISGITLGGSATGWASVATGGSTSVACICQCWVNHSVAGGQTSVAISTSTGSGTAALTASVYERDDLVASASFDKSATSNATSTSWTSTATATTAQAAELWTGLAFDAASAATTLTGPSSPWVNLTQVSQVQGSFNCRHMSGWQVVAATGACTYAGTISASAQWVGFAVTLKTGAAAAGLLPQQARQRRATPAPPGLALTSYR